MQVERQAFYEPREILKEILDKIERTREIGETIDYLTFVPDGEPTLDLNLGSTIDLLRPLGLRIAVITNSSLLWREDVRQDLGKADWASVKVDSVREEVWRRIDRPHGILSLASILDGMLEFTQTFEGELATETMLVAGVNDCAGLIREVADFVARLWPATAYLSIPTRPPAEAWGQAPDEEAVSRAYQIFDERLQRVELLVEYEGSSFTFTGDVEDELLGITAVHPMRQEAMGEFLARAEADWSVVQRLIQGGKIVEVEHQGQRFYTRRFPGRVQ